MKKSNDFVINPVVLGSRIASERAKHGLTQQQLADELSKLFGKSQSSLLISAWERGRRHPTEDVLPLIAEYFDVSVEYLCGLSDTPDADDNTAGKSAENSFNIELQISDINLFDGRVVFLAFQNYAHEDQFAIVNADREAFIIRDGYIPFASKNISAVYANEPDYLYFRSLNGLYPVDMATLRNGSSNRFEIKMKTSDQTIQKKYNGWYRRNEDKTALVNEQWGYVLPIDGLNVSFYAYAAQKPVFKR